METLFAAAAAIGVVLILLLGLRRAPVKSPSSDELAGLRAELRSLSERMAADAAGMSARLEGIDSRMVQTQATSTELAQGIFDSLGDVRRATQSVAEQAREFTSLQDLLKPPKARGGLGEALLEELLRQVLPPQAYEMQHRFETGTIVDAVVRAGGRLVCIDSKFPLANYRRMCDAHSDVERLDAERAFAADVDKHIKDVAGRYVVPDEGTFEFAVMYVPAEGVYAEILRLAHRKQPLFEIALAARIVPMSPLTLYGYLQTVLYGLRCLRIEEGARDILDFCGRLQNDVERFASEYETLGGHISRTQSKYEEGRRRLDRFRTKLERVADFEDEVDDDDRPPLEVVAD
ncbi:MAG TPA: DNA recombination protein RmuC [Actinomycetota bacterium]|nr:DNA recombination protein RmuC [Actinomycetota bacterium]